MERWRTLFNEFRSHEAERLERERRVRQREIARHELEAWSRRASDWLLAALCEAAERRSDELALHAGVRVTIKQPRHAPSRSPVRVTFVELRRDADAVYVYAYHELGYVPLVHYLMPTYDGFLERSKHPRLISLPGCRLARGDDDRVVLRRIELDGSGADAGLVSVDDLAFRAFELLLRGRCAHRAARVELPPGAETVVYGSPPSARA